MNKYKLIKILALVVATLLHFEINAQNNTIIRKEGHFFAVLDFTPASGVYKQKNNRIVNPSHQQFFPNEYTENNITIKGMVKGAMLSMDWWTLFGEPVENYNFQWTTTGQYYVSVYGGFSRTITRNMVSKYPDLLMRFDAIKPLDVKFIIYWRHSDEAYKKRLHYTFSSSNRNQSVSTNVTTGLLFEPSGKEPLSVPGIRQGKGLEFIDKIFDSYQHYNLDEETKKSWLEEFNKANSIFIDAFYATEVRWPVGEMKAIAELYDKYEKGEAKPTPLEIVEEELIKSQNLTAYNNNDFWAEAFEEKEKNYNAFIDGDNYLIRRNNHVTYSINKKSQRIENLGKYGNNGEYFVLSRYRDWNRKFIRSGGYTVKNFIDKNGVVQTIDGITDFEQAGGFGYHYCVFIRYESLGSGESSQYQGIYHSREEALRSFTRYGFGDRANFGIATYRSYNIETNLNVKEKKDVYMIVKEK